MNVAVGFCTMRIQRLTLWDCAACFETGPHYVAQADLGLFLSFVCLFLFFELGSFCVDLANPGTCSIEQGGLECEDPPDLPLPPSSGLKHVPSQLANFLPSNVFVIFLVWS